MAVKKGCLHFVRWLGLSSVLSMPSDPATRPSFCEKRDRRSSKAPGDRVRFRCTGCARWPRPTKLTCQAAPRLESGVRHVVAVNQAHRRLRCKRFSLQPGARCSGNCDKPTVLRAPGRGTPDAGDVRISTRCSSLSQFAKHRQALGF